MGSSAFIAPESFGNQVLARRHTQFNPVLPVRWQWKMWIRCGVLLTAVCAVVFHCVYLCEGKGLKSLQYHATASVQGRVHVCLESRHSWIYTLLLSSVDQMWTNVDQESRTCRSCGFVGMSNTAHVMYSSWEGTKQVVLVYVSANNSNVFKSLQAFETEWPVLCPLCFFSPHIVTLGELSVLCSLMFFPNSLWSKRVDLRSSVF